MKSFLENDPDSTKMLLRVPQMKRNCVDERRSEIFMENENGDCRTCFAIDRPYVAQDVLTKMVANVRESQSDTSNAALGLSRLMRRPSPAGAGGDEEAQPAELDEGEQAGSDADTDQEAGSEHSYTDI